MPKLSTLAKPRWLCALVVFSLLLVLTRWPFIPHDHLFHIDNVNFALALDHFDPPSHQPQPPGYPLYVGLTRILRVLVPRPETLFPVSGLIGSALALLVFWQFASKLAGNAAGWAASVLLLLNPIFWLAGVANYVRVYLALGAVTVALLVWECWTATDERRRRLYFCASAAALGLAAGFRPETAVLLFPLVASSVIVHRLPLRDIGLGTLCLAATVLPWLVACAVASGGLLAYLHTNSSYLAAQSNHTSFFYGATLAEAARMAAAAIYWTFLGAVSWIWIAALPSARRFTLLPATAWMFLAAWFLPPLLFHTFVHIHNPDHALVSIPVVCLVGGLLMSLLPARAFIPALGAAAILNVVLFFYPARSPFWASNNRIADYTIRTASEVYAGLAQAQADSPGVILWKDGFLTPQEIGYYFPDTPIYTLPDKGQPAIRLHNRYRPSTAIDGEIRIPTGNVIWVDSTSLSANASFDVLGQAQQWGPVRAVRFGEGRHFEVDGRRFVVSRIAPGK